PFNLANLPDSVLSRELNALPADVKSKALTKLSTVTFHGHDLNSMHVIKDSGAIFYGCEIHPARKAFLRTLQPEAALQNRGSAKAAVPIANQPIFHSKQGSTNIIFLDFTGPVIKGTEWNKFVDEKKIDTVPFYTVPFDMDGDTSTFNDAEQQVIKGVWGRVA